MIKLNKLEWLHLLLACVSLGAALGSFIRSDNSEAMDMFQWAAINGLALIVAGDSSKRRRTDG